MILSAVYLYKELIPADLGCFAQASVGPLTAQPNESTPVLVPFWVISSVRMARLGLQINPGIRNAQRGIFQSYYNAEYGALVE